MYLIKIKGVFLKNLFIHVLSDNLLSIIVENLPGIKKDNYQDCFQKSLSMNDSIGF